MTIKFVNHASTVFSYDNVNLITDPWLEGEVFHNGWSLLSKTKFSYTDFKDITHIWFSHEHPDHFFPPNIKSIPSELRKNIIVLFQRTNDKKVVEFCKNLNFKEVIELTPNLIFKLTDKFQIINAPFGHDSWLYIKTEMFSFLNTNDCVINTKEKADNIHAITGNIDILLTQFSYASKHGNINQPEKRIKAAKDKFEQMKLQFETFKPKYFIPIASYVWFSHEENFYMNDSINTIDKVHDFSIINKVEPIVLYPGDEYKIHTVHDNAKSINNYLQDINNITLENTRKTTSSTLQELKSSGRKLTSQLKKEDLLSLILLSFYPIKFYLTDLNIAVKFSSLYGIKQINSTKESTNVFLTSEVLDYCLKFNWGFGATNVNGRFQTNKDKDLVLFNYYVSVTDSLNHKDSTFKRVLGKIKRKISL